MSTLDNIVSVLITANTVSPSQKGFGTPLIAAYHTHYSDRVRAYSSPLDMIADGFTTTEPAYLAASAIAAQNPTVQEFKVGRRALPFTASITLQVLDATIGDTVAVTVNGAALSYKIAALSLTASAGCTLQFIASGDHITRSTGSWLADGYAIGQSVTITGTSSNNGTLTLTGVSATQLTFASGIVNEGPLSSAATVTVATPTVAGVANALVTALNAAAPVGMGVSTVSTDTVTLVPSAAGKHIHVAGWDAAKLDVENVTADPGIATDLAAILLADSDWYGLCLDSQSKAEVVAASAWAETNKYLFCYDSSDTSCSTSSTSDVMSTVKAASESHTVGTYNGVDNQQYTGAAELGNRLPFQPGSNTWKFKTLKNITPDILTTTQLNNIQGKNGNVYITVAAINMLEEGVCADGEFVDVVIFIDWLKATLQTRVFAALAANPKIPFTDAGADVIRGVVLGTLADGIKVGGLAASPTPTCTVPLVASVSSTDRANRKLPNVLFQAQLAGAIHKVVINGTVSV